MDFLMKNKNIIIEYKTSVMVDVGWRSVWIKAKARKTSEKMCEVLQVTHIDDVKVGGYQSRTGSKRQTFNSDSIAAREKGKRKRINLLNIL